MSRTRAAHRQQPDGHVIHHTCGQGHCEKPALRDIDVQLCERHLAKAWAAYQLISGTPEVPDREDPKPDYHDDSTPGAVYFIRKGDLLKIGWTSNIAQRFGHLSPDAVFHVEAGTRADEANYHSRFKEHLKEGREWFACNGDTMHIVDSIQRGASKPKKLC